MNYCTVCDRELSDDARDCRYCGAPSTAVMRGLRQGDQWESLADDGQGPLLREDDDDGDRRPAGRSSDPRWDDARTLGDVVPVGAGLSYRVPAKLIDVALRQGLLALLLVLPRPDTAWYEEPGLEESLAGLVVVAVGLFVLIGYPIVFEALWGATPGKFACGLRVVSDEGGSCSTRAAAIRNVVIDVVGVWMIVVGAFFFCWSIATDRRHRHVADRLAGTVVVAVGRK